MTRSRHRLARALASRTAHQTAGHVAITATVTAVDGGRKVITVSPYQGAAAADLLTVPYLAHYPPAAGDVVLLIWVGGNALIAIGKLP